METRLELAAFAATLALAAGLGIVLIVRIALSGANLPADCMLSGAFSVLLTLSGVAQRRTRR